MGGAASIEVVFDKKTSELAIVGSKVYPRCGNDVRFVPQADERPKSEGVKYH